MQKNKLWCMWIKPFIISLIVSIILKVIIHYIPENAIVTDFFAGWVSAGVFFLVQNPTQFSE